jgi:hypothetical protein
MYEFSGNPPVEAEKQPEGMFLFKSNALIYWSMKKHNYFVIPALL